MNETTPPPPTSNRFFSWLRGLGIVRGNDRWFAGVAGGIAAKAGIDPLIVRGIFVVLALLGGPGIILYLAGWLLLPDFTGSIHLENVIRGRASAGVIITTVILGALVAIPLFFRVLPALFFNPWGWDVWGNTPGLGWIGHLFTILWWALIVPALIIWLIVWLSRRGSPSSQANQAGQNGAAGAGAADAAGAAGAAGAASQGNQAHGAGQAAGAGQATGASAPSGEQTSTFAENVGRGATEFAGKAENAANQFGEQATKWSGQAAAWGEKVGNDAKEWDRNARSYYETHKLGAAHTVLTLAIALLAAGAAATWAISNSMSNNLVLTIGLLAPVSVLAVSVIIAGIRGRGSGWLGFLSFVGVLALIFAPFSSLLPDRTNFVPFGNSTTVATDHEPDSATVILAGNSTLDLTQLTADADTRTIDVWVFAGNSKVELPTTAPVQVTTNILGGEIRDDQAGGVVARDNDRDERRFGDDDDALRQSGVFLHRTVGANLDGARESQTIRVNVRLMFGRVEIEGVDDITVSQSQQSEAGQPLAQGQQKSAKLEMSR